MAALSTLDRSPLLTQSEVADAFRVSARTIRRWAATGVLPTIEIGGVRRFRAEDIAALIDPSTSETRTGNPGLAKLAGDGDGHVAG